MPKHPDDEQDPLEKQMQRVVSRMDRLIPLLIKNNELMELIIHREYGDELPSWAKKRKGRKKR